MVEIIRGALGTKEGGSLPQGLWQTELIRALERNWAAREGQPLYALMERAGAALRTYATLHWPDSRCWWIFVGPGNNGGDGYVLARLARQIGIEVVVIAARAPDQLKGDAKQAADEWLAAGGRVWLAEQFDDTQHSAPDLVVDALLGTGVNTPLSPLLTKIVATINGLAVPVLAVDLPSGLNGDTGRAMGAVVQATRTLTFIGIKQGMLTGDGVDCVGLLDCDPLGVTPARRLAYRLSTAQHAVDPAPARFPQGLLWQGTAGGGQSRHAGGHRAGGSCLPAGGGRAGAGVSASGASTGQPLSTRADESHYRR